MKKPMIQFRTYYADAMGRMVPPKISRPASPAEEAEIGDFIERCGVTRCPPCGSVQLREAIKARDAEPEPTRRERRWRYPPNSRLYGEPW